SSLFSLLLHISRFPLPLHSYILPPPPRSLAAMPGVAECAEPREEDPADENGGFGGDKQWHFCDGGLVVRAFEDFMEAAIGGVVTKASVDLARWCAERCPEGTWGGRRCVELGAGCGLVSGALLRRHARVVATDMEPLLEHLRWNLSLNAEDGSPEHGVEALSWEDGASRQALRARLGPDGAGAVLAANCVYSHDAIGPFLATVEALSGKETLALMCGIPVPKALGQGAAAGQGPASTEPGAATEEATASECASEEATLIDGFLAAAPGLFDAH
ncbi:unnamed protein product, partial [Prorocentrum cordatum]